MDATAKVFLLKRLANASHNKIYPPAIVKTEVPLERILLVTRLWNNVRNQQVTLAAQTHESSSALLDDWFLATHETPSFDSFGFQTHCREDVTADGIDFLDPSAILNGFPQPKVDPMATPLPSSVLTPCDWSWLDDAKPLGSLNHEVSDTLTTYSGSSPILSESFELPQTITPLEQESLLEDDLSSLVRLITEEQNRMAQWAQQGCDQALVPRKRLEDEYDDEVLAIMVQPELVQPEAKRPRLDIKPEPTGDCQSILTMCSVPANQFHRHLHFPLIDTSPSQSAGPTSPSSPSSPVLLSA
ncbi:hypothetical protein CLU79DRAFT_736566 [Phycomyces nitens]|nr:hypothetical protein CLU79DRAFT_736566 [Phycomyces nitens]